jgi:hypothetical protein
MEERYVAKGAILNRFNTHPPVTRRRRIDSIHELPRRRVLGNYHVGAIAHIVFYDTENWASSL